MPRRGDGDDWIDEMADEVADALADLGLFDEATRATLVETMREAVAEIPSRDDDSEDDEDEDDDHPNVTVLPGGRGEDDAPTPGAPPTLRVVEGSGGDDDDDDSVAVRVLRLGRRPRSRVAGGEGVSADGHIQLPAQLGHSAEIWQTILHAAAPRAYRVRCDSGELQVMADGDLVVRLVPGQTSDVEGAVIRVRGDGVASATGRYTRLG